MEINVTDANFKEEVLESVLPVLVDFWAPWCGPCHMVAPVVTEIAEEQEGKLKVCKCNVDESQSTAAHYQIMGIPALILFKDGQVVEQIVGAVPKMQIDAKIKKYV